MVQDSEISRHDLVLQDGASGDVDPVAMVGDDDDCPPETNTSAEGDITRYGEMIQLQHVRNTGEPLQELRTALEMLAELHNGS